MQTYADAATGYLLALYRAWPALPRKATLVYLDGARAVLAAELASDDAPAALQRFATLAEQLPGVLHALAAARAPLHSALKTAAPLAPAERTHLIALAAVDDPFAAALDAMFWQPPQMAATLDALRRAAADPHLPVADPDAATRAAKELAAFDAALPAARAAYVDTLALYTRTLDALQAIPALRRLAWRALLEGKVAAAGQIVTRLGSGTSHPLPDRPKPDQPPAPPAEAAAQVRLYSDVDFPRTVKRSTTLWEPLIVRLVTTPVDAAPDSAACRGNSGGRTLH